MADEVAVAVGYDCSLAEEAVVAEGGGHFAVVAVTVVTQTVAVAVGYDCSLAEEAVVAEGGGHCAVVAVTVVTQTVVTVMAMVVVVEPDDSTCQGASKVVTTASSTTGRILWHGKSLYSMNKQERRRESPMYSISSSVLIVVSNKAIEIIYIYLLKIFLITDPLAEAG
ncbi:hypothetical protein CRG98_016853 [Punica granatum]|uniref:Uncharacterized protein n=1 Tax=Punica granatum TaxID=22663 RepID=A0A2I0K2H9_PUNGR|nr:hypothetical protein CRG98_016853 [Punica granatum]